jgi:sugar/nucleoside kinase (ribokinase family)
VADAVYVRSRELDLVEAMADLAGRSLVVAHVPPLASGSRPAHVLVGSESDLPAGFLSDPWKAGREIAGERLRLVVVTRGPRGAEAVTASEKLTVAAPAVAVVDSTGAGDVFAAGLVHALALGRPTAAGLETASAWGASAVAGNGLPDRGTIQNLA